jgi:RNA recognition motif-containing protein
MFSMGLLLTCQKKVESVFLIEDRETGGSRGFGFIEMSTKEEGSAAIQKFNGQEVAGRALKVNEAKQLENPPTFDRIRSTAIAKSEEISGFETARGPFQVNLPNWIAEAQL